MHDTIIFFSTVIYIFLFVLIFIWMPWVSKIFNICPFQIKKKSLSEFIAIIFCSKLEGCLFSTAADYNPLSMLPILYC